MKITEDIRKMADAGDLVQVTVSDSSSESEQEAPAKVKKASKEKFSKSDPCPQPLFRLMGEGAFGARSQAGDEKDDFDPGNSCVRMENFFNKYYVRSGIVRGDNSRSSRG